MQSPEEKLVFQSPEEGELERRRGYERQRGKVCDVVQVASIFGSVIATNLIVQTYPVAASIAQVQSDCQELLKEGILVGGNDPHVFRFREVLR